jgi:hypothetical protein
VALAAAVPDSPAIGSEVLALYGVMEDYATAAVISDIEKLRGLNGGDRGILSGSAARGDSRRLIHAENVVVNALTGIPPVRRGPIRLSLLSRSEVGTRTARSWRSKQHEPLERGGTSINPSLV